MKYLLLIYRSEAEYAAFSPEEGLAVVADFAAFEEEMKRAGVLRAGVRLNPVGSATTVRRRDGRTLTTDGPFAETEEQLGGHCLIECASLDDALAWAAKCPAARGGSVEVRPVMSISEP